MKITPSFSTAYPQSVPRTATSPRGPRYSGREIKTQDKLLFSPSQRKATTRASLFEGIPAASDVASSKEHLNKRLAAIADVFVARPLPDWRFTKDAEGDTGSKVSYLSDIHLRRSHEVGRINTVLSSAVAYRDVGTHANIPLFGRQGDYDFALMTATALVYNHLDNPALDKATRDNLIRNVLNQEGADHIESHWLFGLIPETENHVLMTESSRYLKNQLVQKLGPEYASHNLDAAAYDNQKNGFDQWLIKHLGTFTRHDFDEYNSRPYQAYTVRAIQNLYDFAEDPKVQKSAAIVMDYISARFATQSSDLRRVVPFRRRHNYAGRDNLFEKDSQSARFAILAGNYNAFDHKTKNPMGFAQTHMLYPSLSSYRVPDLLLDTMIDKGSNPYFMRSHAENTELVYAEEEFVISAGGHFHDWSKLPFSEQENGRAMPTVVMLKNGGPSLSQMLRFEGRGDGGKANNTGVFENFASGIRPVFPADLKAELQAEGHLIEKGPWLFAQTNGVYIALYTAAQDSPDNYAPSVGFTEVVDRSEFSSLNAFIAQVEQNNQDVPYRYYGENSYTTTRGKTISFVMAEPLEKSWLSIPGWPRKVPPNHTPKEWMIKRVTEDGVALPLETRFDRWPLVDSYTLEPEDDGENNDYILQADGTGQVLINNPSQNASLLMSLADPKAPIRIEQAGEAVNLSEQAAFKSHKTSSGALYELNFEQLEHLGYLSLLWQKGSQPESVNIWLKTEAGWRLVDERSELHQSSSETFRSDFELTDFPRGTTLLFEVKGTQLELLEQPEAYRAYP